MEIKMYPSFNEVFTNDELFGVFYPLCSVEKQTIFTQTEIIIWQIS